MVAVTLLELGRITVDAEGVQARVPNPVAFAATVSEYADALARGEELPPPVVFSNGQTIWLAGGFLTYAAHAKMKRKSIACDVRLGGHREAMLFAAGANLRHGLPRTPADKRLAILRLLQDEVCRKWTQSEIAKHCGTSLPLVAALQRVSKTGAEATEVVGARATRAGGAPAPQTPSTVFRPTEPAKVKEPNPRPEPQPKPQPPASVNPWANVFEPLREAFVPSDKDVAPLEDADGADELVQQQEAAQESDLDRSACAERLRRALRKAERFASRLGMSLEESCAWFREGEAADSTAATPSE